MTLTAAERIAEQLGDNGMTWRNNAGFHLDELAEMENGDLERHPSTPDVHRWVFSDGSVITCAGEAWDFGFRGCWCWAGSPAFLHPDPDGRCDEQD